MFANHSLGNSTNHHAEREFELDYDHLDQRHGPVMSA
jgi:hypothetical protein